MNEPVVPFSVEPSANNHLAWVCTVLGLQRTHMAAVRTGIALIGFGFTVAEVLRYFQRRTPEELRYFGPEAPRDVGLALIAAGVFWLTLFTLHYGRAAAYLRSPVFDPIVGSDARAAVAMPMRMISLTVIAIGVLAFGVVFLRV